MEATKKEAPTPCIEPLKPARPYTEYNIFFQLEREYVLQVLLGVKPTVSATDIFDPVSDDYVGPPLPSRYSKLVLLDDWYVPGKARRRKRRHRKSHGKIGFHDLSQKIAQAWADVDEETRAFCAKLSDIGMLQYKDAMRNYKRRIEANKLISSQKDQLIPPDDIIHQKLSSEVPEEVRLEEELNSLSRKVATSNAMFDSFSAQFQAPDLIGKDFPEVGNLGVDQIRPNEAFGNEVSKYLTLFRPAKSNDEWTTHCVDMEDDEIRFLWGSISGQTITPSHQTVDSAKTPQPQQAPNVNYSCLSDSLFCVEIGTGGSNSNGRHSSATLQHNDPMISGNLVQSISTPETLSFDVLGSNCTSAAEMNTGLTHHEPSPAEVHSSELY